MSCVIYSGWEGDSQKQIPNSAVFISFSILSREERTTESHHWMWFASLKAFRFASDIEASVFRLQHMHSKDLMPSGVQRRYYSQKQGWKLAKEIGL